MYRVSNLNFPLFWGENVAEIKLVCPIGHCHFYIAIYGETEWKKVHNAFCQHLLENHTPQQLVEAIYEYVAAEVKGKHPDFSG